MLPPFSKLSSLKSSSSGGWFKAGALKAGLQEQRFDDHTVVTLKWDSKREGYLVEGKQLNKKGYNYQLWFLLLSEARDAFCATPEDAHATMIKEADIALKHRNVYV